MSENDDLKTERRSAPPVRWSQLGRRHTDKSPVSMRMVEESESRQGQIKVGDLYNLCQGPKSH